MNIDVYQDEEKKSKGINSWSFSVDGQESGYWCPNEHAVRRVVGRLQNGMSREAFGNSTPSNLFGFKSSGRGKVISVKAEINTETVTLGSGRMKQREIRPKFSYELDGVKSAMLFSSEQEAKVALAFHAFMTRGKLGRLRECEEEFERVYGKKGLATYDGKSVTVTDEEGNVYCVGLYDNQVPRFKLKE